MQSGIGLRAENWEEFASHAIQKYPDLQEGSENPYLDDLMVGELVEKPGFEQTLMDYARANYETPQDPQLSGLVMELAHRAVLGDEWLRADDMISGPWELEVVDIADQLRQTLRDGWDDPAGPEDTTASRPA